MLITEFFISILISLLPSDNSSIKNSVYSYQKFAKGCVYHDVNENEVMDEGEVGIANVYVSNGVDIVKTDKGENIKSQFRMMQ